MTARRPSSWLASVCLPSHHDQLWLSGIGLRACENLKSWVFRGRAAYRNRTDDLRITRSPGPRSGRATLHSQRHMRPGMLPAHSALQIAGHDPGQGPASLQ
jgi:hypothetical protein